MLGGCFLPFYLPAGTVIAWSGKGMYENCCDSGETMPSYYLDTLGSGAYAGDWDFARFTPDAMVRCLVRLCAVLMVLFCENRVRCRARSRKVARWSYVAA